jgi:hypothetical protein
MVAILVKKAEKFYCSPRFEGFAIRSVRNLHRCLILGLFPNSLDGKPETVLRPNSVKQTSAHSVG